MAAIADLATNPQLLAARRWGCPNGRYYYALFWLYELNLYPLEGTNMKNLLKSFVKDEDGAVTVDWVVLTAAIVGIALAVILTIRGGINNAAADIAASLSGVLT